MALTPSTIKPSRGSRRNSKRVGRGKGSGKGTYSTRGLKGQRSRSGGKSGLKRRSFKAQLQKVPKLRGFKSFKDKPETITLAQLEKAGEEGVVVTPLFLKKKGVISTSKNGIKIVATGEIKKKLEITDCLASKGALEAIEKVGGKVIY